MEREARVELVYFCLEGRRVTKNTSPAFDWWLWKVSILPPRLMKPVRIRLRHTT